MLLEDAVESSQDGARLDAVAPGPDAEVHVGVRDLEVLEEHVGQHRVVVLAGVHDDVLDTRRGRARAIGASLTNWGRAPTTLRSFTGDDAIRSPWYRPP